MKHKRLDPRSGFAAAPVVVLLLVIVVAIYFILQSSNRVADGPVPVIWDKTPCAFCAMHVGDPRFAAQLSTAAGDTYFYDDPGCLFLHEAQLGETTQVHRRWFRNHRQDGWLETAEVAFERSEDTPMNFGFGAVPQATPGALSREQAAAEVLKR